MAIFLFCPYLVDLMPWEEFLRDYHDPTYREEIAVGGEVK